MCVEILINGLRIESDYPIETWPMREVPFDIVIDSGDGGLSLKIQVQQVLNGVSSVQAWATGSVNFIGVMTCEQQVRGRISSAWDLETGRLLIELELETLTGVDLLASAQDENEVV